MFIDKYLLHAPSTSASLKFLSLAITFCTIYSLCVSHVIHNQKTTLFNFSKNKNTQSLSRSKSFKNLTSYLSFFLNSSVMDNNNNNNNQYYSDTGSGYSSSYSTCNAYASSTYSSSSASSSCWGSTTDNYGYDAGYDADLESNASTK